MNFDKFKCIDMPDIKVTADSEYLEKINKLPYQKQSGKILSVIGTVAAAILIVLAVGLWAIIGRGIRNTDKNTVSIIPSSKQEFEITDTLNSEFKKTVKQHGFQFLPVFNEENAPSVSHTARYMYYLDIMIYLDEDDPDHLYGFENSFISGATINQFAKNTFRCEVNARKNLEYAVHSEFETRDLTLQSLSSYDTETGEQYFVVKLTDKKGVVYDIAYVGNGYDSPLYYVSVNRSDLVNYLYAEDKMLYALMDYYKDTPYLKDGRFALYNATKLSDTLYACSINAIVPSEEFDVRDYVARFWSGNWSGRYVNTIYFDKDGESFTVSQDQSRVSPLFLTELPTNTKTENTVAFDDFANKYKLWAIPTFEQGSYPDTQELVNYAYALESELFEGEQITGEKLSEFLWKYFKLEYDYGDTLYTAQPVAYKKPQVTDDYGFGRSSFDMNGRIYTYTIGDETRTIAYYTVGNPSPYCFIFNVQDFDLNSIIKETGIY